MDYGFNQYYSSPIYSLVNFGYVVLGTFILALILGVVLYFTVLNRKKEGQYTGKMKLFYDFMSGNRFYADEIVKFVYIVSATVITLLGIVFIFFGQIVMAFVWLVAGNLSLRITYELVLMFIIMVKKTVSMDKRLSSIERFYKDCCDDDCCWEEECCCDDECQCDNEPSVGDKGCQCECGGEKEEGCECSCHDDEEDIKF